MDDRLFEVEPPERREFCCPNEFSFARKIGPDYRFELVSSEGSMSIYAKQAALLESLGKWEKLVEGVGGCKRKHEGDGEDDGESEGEGEEDSSGVSSSPAASRPKTAHPDDLEDT